LKPLTAKELEYIVDSMSNEDLLTKQCVATAVHTSNPAVQQLCQQLVTKHQQHYQDLLTMLQEHTAIAPKTVQEAEQQSQMQTMMQQQQQQQNQGSQSPLQ
jgi:hypothetical protein